MHHLWDLEEKFQQYRRDTMSAEEHTRERERIAVIDQLHSESVGVRRRVASALVQLGEKLDPKAAERLATADEAALRFHLN